MNIVPGTDTVVSQCHRSEDQWEDLHTEHSGQYTVHWALYCSEDQWENTVQWAEWEDLYIEHRHSRSGQCTVGGPVQ